MSPMASQIIGPKQSMRIASRLTALKRAWRKSPRATLRSMASPRPSNLIEYPGRKVGKPEGSHIADLVSLRKAIMLCHLRCRSRFDHKRADYYMDRRFPYVSGKCDGCREFTVQNSLYIHHSFLSEPNGRIRSGQIWRPV